MVGGNVRMNYLPEMKVSANGIELVYDAFGDRSNLPLLLINGLGSQLIAWRTDFCKRLADAGYWVIRFDNRDIGLSTKFDDAGVPNIATLTRDLAQGESVDVPYLLRDMADDAVGLLDALEIDRAHIVGSSMGGMIVQELLIHHPNRIRSATSIMSSTFDPSLPQPAPAERAKLLGTAPPKDRADYIEYQVELWQQLNGPVLEFDEADTRLHAGLFFDRGLSPAGTVRQHAAVIASGSRREALKSVNVPTLVIHGDADPLVLLEGGKDTAASIPNAELLIVEGMGHCLSPQLWPQLIDEIVAHALSYD